MKFNVENVKCLDYKMYNQSLKTMSHWKAGGITNEKKKLVNKNETWNWFLPIFKNLIIEI